MKKQNEWKYLFNNMFFMFLQTMLAGAILQGFMLESGISEKQVALYMAMTQFMQAIAMFACAGIVDKIKNMIRTGGMLQLACLPMFVVLCLLCLYPGWNIGLQYGSIMLVGSIAFFTAGVYSILSYKLPFVVLDMERYGVILAYCGILQGICGVAIAFLMSWNVEGGTYYPKMLLIFSACGVLLLVAAILHLRMKTINEVTENNAVEKKKIHLLQYPPFRLLILPNLLRGFVMGIINLATTIGYFYGLLDGQTNGYMVGISYIVLMVSGYLYGVYSKRFKHADSKLILASSIIIGVLTPMMLVGNSSWVFLIVYGIVYLVYNFVNNAVPVALSRIVDYEIMGQYSAWRMLLTMLGSTLGGLVCVGMLENLGGITTLVIAGGMQLISGFGFYYVDKKYRENK